MTVLVSMITATFNRRDTVGDAVASLRGQSWRDVEHVVVDGGSTDGTLERLEALADPRMHVRSEPDDGIYDALNKGLARASGDIVGLLHSDDLMGHERALEHVVERFADPDVDAVYGDMEYFHGERPERTVRHWYGGRFTPAKLRRGWMPPHPTLYARRSVYERLGGFDPGYRIAADYDLVLRWFGAGGVRPAYLPETLTRMRMGGASTGSLRQITTKSAEDYRALRAHPLGWAAGRHLGPFATIASKNLVKLPQLATLVGSAARRAVGR